MHDYLRILHTMRLEQYRFDKHRHPVWLWKGRHAIEEFLYARFFRYWAVYYHKTTRGFEELFKAILTRAGELATQRKRSRRPECLPGVKELVERRATWRTLMCLDDNSMLAQISCWRTCSDRVLSDLCARFLDRRGFKPLGPIKPGESIPKHKALLKAQNHLKRNHMPPECYFLVSDSVATAYDYYRPEEETTTGEPSPIKSIVLTYQGSRYEISNRLPGVRALKEEPNREPYCYVPREHASAVTRILADWLEV